MRTLANNLLTLSLCLTSTSILAQSSNAPSKMSHAEKIDKIFSQYDKVDSPGCAALAIRDGKTIYERVYGSSNLEHSIPISVEQTRFEIGSTAKQFTATALLLLVQEGKLSLDDDVRKFVPQVPDYGTTITLRHLLNHTSGLRDYITLFNLNGYSVGEVTSESDALEMIVRQKGLNFKPGSAYAYSNSGYFLLSQVIKAVSGKTLAEFAKERIFTPLGMQKTEFVSAHDKVIPNRASSYRFGQDKQASLTVFNDESVGAHGVWTTVQDLAKWDQNFYLQKLGGSWLIEQLQNTGKLDDGSPLDYASGLLISKYRGLPIVHHSGALAGFRTELVRFPKQNFSVAVTCNLISANAVKLSRQVADTYLEGQFASPPEPVTAVPVTVAELRRYEGVYWSAVKGQAVSLVVEGDKLLYKDQGKPVELVYLGDTRFGAGGSNSDRSYLFFVDGKQMKLQVKREGGISAGDWVRVAPLNQVLLASAAIAGTYRSSEIDPRMTIKFNDGKLTIIGSRWEAAEPLVPLFADTYRFGPVILQFDRDKNQRVTGFNVYADRVLGIKFKREGN